MATSGSEEETATEMVPEKRPLMPSRLFTAAMKGDRDFLIRCLGLPDHGERNHSEVQIDASESTLPQGDLQFYIRSATNSGNTILHLLITRGHNELALKVFQNDMSLLKAQNKKSETPLHCAAKVGNEKVVIDLIQLNSGVVKEAAGKTNDNGDTALHVAAKHGNIHVGCELMILSSEMAYKVNNEGSSPLCIAIANGFTEMAMAMLEKDATLACTEDSDGMFPVHVAARMGNKKLVKHFIEKHPNYALNLLDPRGRNLFHIAAEENCDGIFQMLCRDEQNRSGITMILDPIAYGYLHGKYIATSDEGDGISYDNEEIKRMINAQDYEGNTPLHIAAMKGHKSILKTLWEKKMHHNSEQVRNKQGLTPLEVLPIKTLKEIPEDNEVVGQKLKWYMKFHGSKFTKKLFNDVMKPLDKNRWDKVQVIGLGAVLITTIAFAAAFTVPGGYNQEKGTPVLGRRYMFRAFILANAMAFITSFMSLLLLLIDSSSYEGYNSTIDCSGTLFFISSGCIVVAFGLGSYVTLAPDNKDIAVLILVFTILLGTPFGQSFILFLMLFLDFIRGKTAVQTLFGISLYVVIFVWIFCVA